MSTNNPFIFFDHIFKTGGTSLKSFFSRQIGEENVCNIIGQASENPYSKRLNKYPLVTGHIAPRYRRSYLDSGRYNVVFVRHPVQLQISIYHYFKELFLKGQSNLLSDAAHTLSFEEWVSSDRSELFNLTRNYLTYQFSGGEKPPMNGDDLLSEAISTLEKYDFIGIFESLEESVDLFCAKLNWPFDDLERLNITNNKSTYIESDILNIVEENCKIDLIIYEYCVKRLKHFRRKMITGGKFDRLQNAADSKEDPLPALCIEHTREDSATCNSLKVEIQSVVMPAISAIKADIKPGQRVKILFLVRAEEEILNILFDLEITDSTDLVIYKKSSSREHGSGMRLIGKKFYVGEFSIDTDIGAGQYFVNIRAICRGNLLAERRRAASFWVEKTSERDFVGIANLNGDFQLKIGRFASYSGLLTIDQALEEANCSEVIGISARVVNYSQDIWSSQHVLGIFASYHWYDGDGAQIAIDEIRSLVPEPIQPGGDRELLVNIKVPERAGTYRLVVTLVHEFICWFEEDPEFRAFSCMVTVHDRAQQPLESSFKSEWVEHAGSVP